MGDICESIYYYFLKCFRSENKKENQVEYTKMLPKIRVNSRKSKSSFVSSLNEENTLKFKDSDSNIKLSIVEEKIIFSSEYLNSTESDSNFKFEFTKKNLIEFFETEIKDTDKYKLLVNKNEFDIYIKESGSIFSSEFPMIKMFYKIPKSTFKTKEVNIKILDEYMNIPSKRLEWDKSIKDYKIIKNINSKENEKIYLLHYICKSPMILVSERDVVEKRYDFYEKDIYYDFSSSVKDDYIPLGDNIVRITDHCSLYKMYEEKDYFNFISITQVDTKFNMPNSVLSYQLPNNYKIWYDSLFKAINEQNKENDKPESSEPNELDEPSSERLTSSETN